MKEGCVITTYCDDDSKEYNSGGIDLSGKILCPDKEKKPMPSADSKSSESKIDASLKIAGQRNFACKNKKAIVKENPDLASSATKEEKDKNEYYWAKTAKQCFDKVKTL